MLIFAVFILQAMLMILAVLILCPGTSLTASSVSSRIDNFNDNDDKTEITVRFEIRPVQAFTGTWQVEARMNRQPAEYEVGVTCRLYRIYLCMLNLTLGLWHLS